MHNKCEIVTKWNSNRTFFLGVERERCTEQVLFRQGTRVLDIVPSKLLVTPQTSSTAKSVEIQLKVS